MSKITAERARELLAYEPETGVLRWRVATSSRADAGSAAGTQNKHGYIVVAVDCRKYQSHRLAWLIVHGAWPKGEIDHLNGDRTDNRLANLRDVSRRANCENIRVAQSNNRTGLLGVSTGRSGFRATIQTEGQQRYLGTFDTAEAAHAAYLTAKRHLHEGNTL